MNQATKTRSAVSFVRRGLGLKGYTEHNGRGGYECCVDDEAVTWGQLKELALKKATKWKEQGLVLEIKESQRKFTLTGGVEKEGEVLQLILNPTVFGQYYSTVHFDQIAFEGQWGHRYAVLF